MDSPIFRLIQVLEHVHATAEEYHDTLSKSEAATRAALIDPILRALGWDVSNPQRVEVEKTIDGVQIDYALQSDGEYKFAIEAKKLEEDLTKHFGQAARYSISLKVRDLFITDGIRWNHYQSIAHDNTEPAYTINLTTGALPDIAAYLVRHLDAALSVTDSPVEDRLAELTNQFEALKSDWEGMKGHVDTIEKRLHTLETRGINSPPAVSPRPSLKNWQELYKLDESEYTGKRPIELRLPNGEEQKVSTWKNVLVECCRFALTENPLLLKNIPMPDKTGRKINLIQKIKPASSASYASLNINGEMLWVHTTYSAKNAIENCLYITDKASAKSQNSLAVVLPSD